MKIPASIAPGEYVSLFYEDYPDDISHICFQLLRHELLALHGGQSLNGAQFYPVCVQLTVTGSGTKTPSGLGFPGLVSSFK